jgi:hypothetical protein
MRRSASLKKTASGIVALAIGNGVSLYAMDFGTGEHLAHAKEQNIPNFIRRLKRGEASVKIWHEPCEVYPKAVPQAFGASP